LIDLTEVSGPPMFSLNVSGPKARRDVISDLVRDLNWLDDLPQQLGEPFLTDVGVPALAVEAGAR
jgi:hypothetical protein